MKVIWFCLVIISLLLACHEEEPVVGNLVGPAKLSVNAEVANDQSGNVTVTPSGENVINFHIIFENGDDPVVVPDGQSTTYRYTQSGQYTETIKVIAYGKGGLSSNTAVDIELDVRLSIDQDTLQMIAGDGSKRWVWNRTVGGHFGVGPLTNRFPEFFSASPNMLNPCLYDDVLVFSYDENDNFSFNLESGETKETFMNWTEVNRFFPEATPVQFADECRDITSLTTFKDDFVVIENSDKTKTLNIGSAFLSYWAVISGEYEILELSENKLALRGISQPFNGDEPLAWYFEFVPENQVNTGNENLETQFSNLIWSDEFDVNGAPNPTNWTYDLGNGNNGWGNGELQTYTNNPENVTVTDGNLKITLKSESSTQPTAFYFDNVNLSNVSGDILNILENFETTSPTFENFGGSIASVVANPDMSGENTSNTVGELTKPAGSEEWAGSFFDLTSPLDLSITNQISITTWSPKVGAVVKLKLENSANSDQSFEVDVSTTVVNNWEKLIYDFKDAPDFSYDRFVIFYDFGVAGISGATYTSSRIKSERLQEFTYGRAEVRAKLPTGGGTWPAIWLLGSNFNSVGWPACGEIDIMEHVGNQQNVIHGTLHESNNFGAGANTASTIVNGVSDEFHIYELEWTASNILFAVDGKVFHEIPNNSSLPFNQDFFFIINVAMGGSFGGNVDSEFTSSSMEVDYVRMYQ